jgi:hypothetical protein
MHINMNLACLGMVASVAWNEAYPILRDRHRIRPLVGGTWVGNISVLERGGKPGVPSSHVWISRCCEKVGKLTKCCEFKVYFAVLLATCQHDPHFFLVRCIHCRGLQLRSLTLSLVFSTHRDVTLHESTDAGTARCMVNVWTKQYLPRSFDLQKRL